MGAHPRGDHVRILRIIGPITGFVDAGPPTLGLAHPPFRAVPVVQPTSRPIARVAKPAAESSTILARCPRRCSVLAVLDLPVPAGYACWNGPLIGEALGDVDVQYVWRILRAQQY